jgi:hypothetical protein
VLLKSSGKGLSTSSSDKNDVNILVAPIQKPLYASDDERGVYKIFASREESSDQLPTGSVVIWVVCGAGKAVTINTKIDSLCEFVPYQPLKLALPHQIVFCVDYDLGRLGTKKVGVRAEWQPVYDER